MEPTGDECRTEPLSLSAIEGKLIDYVWHSQLPAIKRGLSRGAGCTSTASELLQRIKDGKHSLWAIHRGLDVVAVIVVSMLEQNNKLFVELLAGQDMDEWIDQLEELLVQCKRVLGVDSIEASCRVGLARFLQRRGWRQKAIVMRLT